MDALRKTLSRPIGKILAIPALVVILLVVALVGITVDDLARGGDCKSAIYDKSAKVFDAVVICGTSDVPQEKVDYAAAVAAQWLDNDQDGVADEPRLLEELQATNPVVMMTPSGLSAWPAVRTLIAHRGIAGLQDLGAQETNPGDDRRDAAPEEIHHLIMTAGWQQVWPELFGDVSSGGSTLSQAWTQAEADQVYSYDDTTCDNDCKVVEFVYLASAAYLGSDVDLGTDELRLANRDELATSLPSVIELFESSEYVYPTVVWPNGDYAHPENIVAGDG